MHSKGSSCCIGWASSQFDAPDALHESLGSLSTGWCLNLTNGKLRHRRRERHNDAQLKSRAALTEYADGDVLGLAVDFAVGELWVARNDEWFIAFTCEPSELAAAAGLYPVVEGVGALLTINLGAAPFVHGPPDSRYYAPWAPVVPLGYCEPLRGQRGFVLTALWRPEALQQAATDAVEWVRRRVAEHRSHHKMRCAGLSAPPTPLRVQRVVPVCSALPGGEQSGEAVRTQLEALSCATPPLLPSMGFVIPHAWCAPIAFLRALRDGVPPAEAARRAAVGDEPLDPRTNGEPGRARPYERVTTLRTLWEAAAPVALAGGVLDAQLVDEALGLLAAQGEVFVSAGMAYLDPSFVATLMKPLVDHRLSLRTSAVGFAEGAAHASALVSAVGELVHAGVLHEELLPLLWRDTGLLASDYRRVLSMLEEAGVIFPVTGAPGISEASHPEVGTRSSGGGSRWVMPMRLPKQRPVDIPSGWNHQLFRAQDEEISRMALLDLGSFVPPGLIERLMAACYSLGRHHYFWRRPSGAGALITVALQPSGEPISADGCGSDGRLLLDIDETDEIDVDGASSHLEYTLRFEVFAPGTCEAEAEGLLAKARELMECLLRDFPGMVASPIHGRVTQWREG